MYEVKDIKRFWDKVKVGTKEECWPWTASVCHNYGQFNLNNKRWRSHRLAYSMANSATIPDDLVVMHSCDNRLCQNPHHLSLGTPKDNVHDCIAKGRAYWQKS